MPEPEESAADTHASEPASPPPASASLIDEATGLVQTVVTYVRQETGDVVREKIVRPTQQAGATAGLAIGVGLVLALGIGYVSVGALVLLAAYITWPGALFLVGGVLIVAAAGLAYVRTRKMQP